MVLPRLHFLYDISCCNSSNRCVLQPSAVQYEKENHRVHFLSSSKAIIYFCRVNGVRNSGRYKSTTVDTKLEFNENAKDAIELC
jgi:hypothetical protein